MNRAVYIGGFGNGKANARGVAEALVTCGYDDADHFTFSQAISDPNKIRRAVEGMDVFSHSAGMLALLGTWPESIKAFNAPLPVSVKDLVTRTLTKTVHMHQPGRGIHMPTDILKVVRYDASATAELVRHPKKNLSYLNEIATFNAYNAAINAARSGIDVDLVYTYEDDYFPPLSHDLATQLVAGDAGVKVGYLEGEHDELILRPVQTLEGYFEQADRFRE